MRNVEGRWLFFIFWGLTIFGIITISSVSVYESHQLEIKNNGRQIFCQRYPKKCQNSFFNFSASQQREIKNLGTEFCSNLENNCNTFYLRRHLLHIILGFFVFMFGVVFPIEFLRKLALPIFLFSLALLGILFISGIGNEAGSARSWIHIPFLPSIQPSEIAKMALIFYFAVWMEKKEVEVRTWHSGFVPFVLILLPVVFFLAKQPDFGSLMVIASIAGSMFFVAGGNILHIFIGSIISAAISLPVIFSHQYILDRFSAFLNPENSDAGYQILQSLIAVGSGKFFGVGIGNSGQRYGWLPEIQGDTIFAAAAEELGFFRIIFLVGIFFIIAILGFRVAKKSRSRFEMLVSVGITTWIVLQAFINIGVTIAILPLTGITLPFISYGGSSLLSLLFAVGILLQISKKN